MELAIPYALTGPDGTRIVAGNSDAAKLDPDYVGWLDPEQGIAGLDSPDLRDNSALVVAGDGGIHYDFFHGRRPLVANVVLNPSVMDVMGVAALEQKVKRAHNAVRGDALLRWTNTGFPQRRLALRKNGATRIVGRRPKNATLELVDADYRILSDDLNDLGPRAIGWQGVVHNAGDELATPRFELTGSFGGPIRLRNLTTGLEIRFKAGFSPAAGQALVVDLAPPWPTVTLDGGPRYDAIDFLPTSWWGLVPGDNTVELLAASGVGTWHLLHRDAWI